MLNSLKLRNIVSKLSGTRLFAEIKKFYNEENMIACFDFANKFQLLDIAHPSLSKSFHLNDIVNANKIVNWFSKNIPKEKIQKWQLYNIAIFKNLK